MYFGDIVKLNSDMNIIKVFLKILEGFKILYGFIRMDITNFIEKIGSIRPIFRRSIFIAIVFVVVG